MVTLWRDKLTDEEVRHLREDANCSSLREVKGMFRVHKELRKKYKEPCERCRVIAIKLGEPV